MKSLCCKALAEETFNRLCVSTALSMIAGCTIFAPVEKKDDATSEVLAQSLGELILIQDRADKRLARPGYQLSIEIDSLYENKIRELPLANRIDFFWSVMVNINLNSSFLEDFYWLIHRDCGAEFVRKLDRYIIEAESRGHRGEVLNRAKDARSVLMLIRRSSKEAKHAIPSGAEVLDA